MAMHDPPRPKPATASMRPMRPSWSSEKSGRSTHRSAYSERSARPVSEKPMTPPALKAVLNDSVQPMVGEHAPTVQRALEKTATRIPIQPASIEVIAPTTNDTPESRPVDQPHSPCSMEPHAMRADMEGKTRTTKRAQSLYSALRKELAPSDIAPYSSTSFEFSSCVEEVERLPATDATSRRTEATWRRRWIEKRIPMRPVTQMMRGATPGPSVMPPATHAAASRVGTTIVQGRRSDE